MADPSTDDVLEIPAVKTALDDALSKVAALGEGVDPDKARDLITETLRAANAGATRKAAELLSETKAAKDEAAKLKASVAALNEAGVSLEDLPTALEKLKAAEEAERQRAESSATTTDDYKALYEASKSKAERERANLEKKFGDQVQQLQNALTEQQQKVERRTIETQLKSKLTGMRVAPALLQGAYLLHLEGAELKEVDGEEQLFLGGQPAEETLEAWKGTETGKYFTLAAMNDGGGAGGARVGNGVKPNKPLSQWTPREKTEFISEQGMDEFQKLVKEAAKAQHAEIEQRLRNGSNAA